MPSGYTAYIDKDINFNQFVWVCARAFGALVTMRDDNIDAEIPAELEPNDFYAKRLHESKNELIELESMTREEASVRAQKEYQNAADSHFKREMERLALLRKYNDMLQQVCQWESPSPDHDGLKKFMIEQINESIKWDCTSYPFSPPETNPNKWLVERKEWVNKDIERYTERHQEELDRTDERNRWLRDLRESVPYEEVKSD